MSGKPQKGTRVRLVIVDDHVIVRAGLRLMLEGQEDFFLLGDVADKVSTLHLIAEEQPDVVLMNVRTPAVESLEIIAQIRIDWPEIAVVIFTRSDDEDLMVQGLQAGASCYLIKDADHETLFHAIRTAARGETLLQPRMLARLLARATSAKTDGKQREAHVRDEIDKPLSKREHEVLAGVARGERNKEIAIRLGISEPTVKTHLSGIYYKLSVDSRASAVAVAIERGQLTLPRRAVEL